MIIGVIQDASTAEIFLNNLAEAGFDLADVSVVMQDLKLRDAIVDDGGPLKGVDPSNLLAQLVSMGISSEDAALYQESVTNGKALVAMIAPDGSQDAAKEMFQDQSAEMIQG